MNIKVVYAAINAKPIIISLDVPRGTTALEAIKLSKILDKFPKLAAQELSAGIFSEKVVLDHVVAEHDRIEIYRPLILDPKEQRFLKVRGNKS